MGLARVLKDQRKVDVAIALFKRALELDRKRYGDSHDFVGISAYSLGNAYMAAYEYEPALEYLHLARDIFQRSRGADDQRTRRAADRIEMLENLV